MSIKVCSLGSGSKGNCTYIESEHVKLIVDAGLNLKEIEKRLRFIGVNPFEIDYVCSTHNHIDHVKSIDAFCRRYKAAAVVNKKGYEVLRAICPNCGIIEFNDNFEFNDLFMEGVLLEHDSEYCNGFKFSDGSKSLAILTDLGHAAKNVEDFVKNVDMLLIESNHDVNMLKSGRYPYFLKRRILSDHGHFSNEQAADLVEAAALSGATKIMLMHLSEENNLPELAFSVINDKLKQNKLSEKDVGVFVAGQHCVSKIISL